MEPQMEKPFASLVDAETTDQTLPSERALTQTDVTAYMEFKQSGFQEEADWDRTLLGDGEDSSEADSDHEEVHGAHGMWDDGEVAAEQDPLSTIPGATSSTTLRATAQACQRGLVAKKIDSSNNFELFFDLRLHNRQKDRRGIAHFSVGGVVGSQLPRICVAPNSTHLWIFIRHGHFRAKLATRAIPLNQTVKVRFRLLQNKITVDIDNRIEGILEAEGLHIPVPAKFFAYFNGPGDKAADATVSGAVYRWRHFALRPRVQATTIFELPPDEIQLMREVTNEIQKARRWATFDAIFGLVVLVNAIAMGVRIDCQCGSYLLWQVLDNIFLIAFIIEFCLRAAISGIRHFGIMLLSDSWIQFDFLVVCLSIVDTWVLGGVGSGGVYTLARLYRLLKLVKMVRVLRAFRQLAMLVEGILSSLQTLFWAVLLLGMTIFILSVLLVTMSQWNLAATTAVLPDFTTLPSAMWTLIQVATFDRWVTIARTAAFDLGEAHGTAIAVVILLSACITGLGLMNLVVGILCNTAFKLEARQSRTQGAERLVSQQEALELFRQQLLKHGTYLLKNNRQISKEEFTQALEDSNIKALLRILDLGPEDFKALAAAFEEDGNVEIDGIIEAIGIIELQSYFTRSIANSVKKDKARTALRPVDLLFFTVSLRQLETSMVKIERSGRNLCAFAYDVLSVLYTRAENSFTLLRLNNDVKWAPPGLKSEVAVSSLDVRKMEETANQFNLDSEEQQLVMPIDVLFGSMIVINGAFVGIQATQNDDNTLIYWIDLGFTIIFTIEFILRGILQAGLNYVHQPEDTDTDFNFFEQANRRVSRFSSLRSRMRCWIFPPCPPGGVRSVLAAMCLSLKEFSVLFDFVIIVLSLLDSLVIVQLRNAGVLNLDTSALSVLRAFRLFRLAKLLRVFKLFPQLQKMVFALIETWRQVCWALVLILLVLYAFSIYAVTIVGNDAEPGSPLKKYFGDLRSALLTGWQVTTFDHWGDVLTVSKSNLLNLVVLLLLAVVLGLGLMNMVIGVLCESALGLQAKDEAELQRHDLITFLTAMKNLQEACGKEFGEQLLYANMLERTTGLKMHSKLQPGSEAIERFGSQRTLSHPSVSAQNGQSVQAFQKKLEEAFEKAGLLVKRIFDKVDHGRLGYMTVDDLTKGALVVKEDLAKVELYGCMAALRDVRAKCVKMNECIMKVHVSMQRVLEEMCAVIHRRYQKEMLGSSSAVPNPTDYDASNLCPEAEQALIEMCKWFGEGSLPHIVGMGSLRVSTGTGKVTVLGDEVVGSGTAFRTEVQVGDIILIEPMVVQKSGDAAAKKTLALAVAVVLSQSRLKIAGFMLSEAVPDYVTFVIARAGSPQEEAEPARAPFSGTTASVPKHMSPRSAQHLFEWDLQTQRRDVVNLREAEAENLRLQKLKKEADAELEMVLQRPLMIMCLQAWKSQIKPRQKTVSLLW